MLGVELVGTFVGARPDRTPDENMKEIGQVFRELTRYAADKGVRLMIENCPMDGLAALWPSRELRLQPRALGGDL